MTITNVNDLLNALGNNSTRLVIDKASIGSQASGNYVSMWRATGQPGQGAIPGEAAVCSHALAGAFGFTQQAAPKTSYGAWMNMTCSNSANTVEIHDRLMHMGGLNATLTTAQTVGVNIASVLGSQNLDERKGDSNYSDIQWWLEIYTATGATATTATVGVTYHDGTTGNISVSIPATRPAGLMIPLNGLDTTPKFIRSVHTVTLAATTGTAGNFGVTATRPRMVMPCNVANKGETFDWQTLGLPEIYNSSCLFMICAITANTSGTLRGGGKIAHG